MSLCVYFPLWPSNSYLDWNQYCILRIRQFVILRFQFYLTNLRKFVHYSNYFLVFWFWPFTSSSLRKNKFFVNGTNVKNHIYSKRAHLSGMMYWRMYDLLILCLGNIDELQKPENLHDALKVLKSSAKILLNVCSYWIGTLQECFSWWGNEEILNRDWSGGEIHPQYKGNVVRVNKGRRLERIKVVGP